MKTTDLLWVVGFAPKTPGKMSVGPDSLMLLTFDSINVFNSIRSFDWPSTRFVRRKQKICRVFINTTPHELMDGHVILTRHGLRSSDARGCWSREGALRTPSLHFGWALRQLSIETDAPLAKQGGKVTKYQAS